MEINIMLEPRNSERHERKRRCQKNRMCETGEIQRKTRVNGYKCNVLG